jgi:WXG100 family type VII secretion target
VPTPAMQRAMGLFEGAAQTATNQMREVNDNQARLRSAWQSSNAFAQAMNTWEGQFDTAIRELVHMIEVMGGNAQAYTKNEDSAVNTASGWAMGLPETTDYRTGIPVALETARTMGHITTNIKDMLDELDRNVRSSLQDWTSDARNAYEASKLEWDAAAAQMPTSLAAAQTALGQIIDDFLRTEKYGMNIWSGQFG